MTQTRINSDLEGPGRYPDQMVGRTYTYCRTGSGGIHRNTTVRVEKTSPKSTRRVLCVMVGGSRDGHEFWGYVENFVGEVKP